MTALFIKLTIILLILRISEIRSHIQQELISVRKGLYQNHNQNPVQCSRKNFILKLFSFRKRIDHCTFCRLWQFLCKGVCESTVTQLKSYRKIENSKIRIHVKHIQLSCNTVGHLDSQSVTYLGLTMDGRLTQNLHISDLVKRIRYLIYQLKHHFTEMTVGSAV